MKTHRGINFSSIAGEGLNGFPGFLIAIFFLVPAGAGVLGLLVWALCSALGWDWGWWPLQHALLTLSGLPALLLMIAAACGVYLVSQWRDKQLTARIEKELHKLNEETGSAVPDSDEAIEEFARAWTGSLGLGGFRSEELRSAARPAGFSPEGLLIVILGIVFIAGIVDIFVPPGENEMAVAGVAVALAFAAGFGYVVRRVQLRRQARRVERELSRRV